MGKKKQAQRTKNNVVPASSGRSAELLQSTSGVPFMGFSTLKEGGFIPIISGLSDELDVNINEDFRLVWKKMNKKDTTTKLKALDEFKKLCQQCTVEALKPVLAYWPRLFSTLSTDEEHRVREATHTAHRALVSKAGRNIAPHLKQLVGPWFTGQHDTYAPAASAAEAAFQETFPPNKLIEAIIFCQDEILNYICNNLLDQTPQSLANNQNVSQEAKDARYQRVVVSCLNGYALYLQRLPTEHLRKAEETNRKLVSSAKFWKFNKDPAAIVRAAWFTALVALCEKAPFLLADESKPVCMAVFSNLDETDPSVVHIIWQAVLLTFTVVDDAWKYVSLEKMVLPKLWKVLREGADGTASLIYPNLLPLLSKIPPTVLKDKAVFYSKFFENLRAGLKVRSVQISGKETGAVVTAFLECLRYLININSHEEKLCLSLFQEQVFPLLEDVLTDSSLHHARPCLFPGLANLINSWSKSSSGSADISLYSALTASFWSRLDLLCRVVLENYIVDSTALAANCAAVESLLSALKQPDVQRRRSFKVKFVSPRKSKGDDEDNIVEEEKALPLTDKSGISSAFEIECCKLVKSEMSVCFNLMKSSSDRSRVVLIGHLTRVVEEYESAGVFKHLMTLSQLDWSEFYMLELAQWLRDENVPLDYSLRLVFMLLKYAENLEDVQIVHADLSGENILAAIADEGGPKLEPLQEKWEEVVEWGLTNQSASGVRHWLQSCNVVCRLAALVSHHHRAYNSLHNCVRNLRHNPWLTTDTIVELIKNLLSNLENPEVSPDVKECSGHLLHGMLQNMANHCILAQMCEEDLTSLLYQLFTASLQKLEYFPPSWPQCVSVLVLKSGPGLKFSAVCETCVDLMVEVISIGTIDLAESQQLLNVLEDLITAAVGPADNSDQVPASLTAVVLNRLSACMKDHSEAVWRLYSLAEVVQGSQLDCCDFSQQFKSHNGKDPMASVPLQQYITSMIPFMMLVVRLQTASDSQTEEDIDKKLSYSQLRTALTQEDLGHWTLEVLHLHSLCVSFKQNFSSTKQYFLLKEKITFVLEECGLFSQLKVKNLINILANSFLEEGSYSLLQRDILSKLQRRVIVKDLGLLYDVNQIRKGFLPFKSKIPIVKQHYFPVEVLEEFSASEKLVKENLSTINTCCRRLIELKNAADDSDDTPINILDRVFDDFVAMEKENRNFLHSTDEEILHTSEVADFVRLSIEHFSEHMKQSSWDACMIATAALTLSANTTITRWRRPSVSAPPSPITRDADDHFISLPVARAVCSVFRLFGALSAHLRDINSEDKAGVIRREEWSDVFVLSTHTAMSRTWRIIAELPCDQPVTVLLMEAVSSPVGLFVRHPYFVENSDTLECLDMCCRLLQSSEISVQLAAYQLLIKLVPAMVDLDLRECQKDNIALSCQLVDKTLVYTQSIIEVILSGLRFGDICTVEPFTDSYTYTRCYLFLWCALLELCAAATSELRALYTTWLKETYLPVFMKTVFCLMPESVLHGDVPSQRVAQFFTKPPEFDKGVWSSERLAQMSCWVLASCMRRLPAAMRQWWTEAEHRFYPLVEHVTTTYISRDLIAEELRAIQTHEKKFENMTVHVMPTAKEVYAVYTVEECRMELVIELAHNHPLGLVKVKSGQSMVSNNQTRQWLLQIAIFLTHQNGSIWDALELWKDNLDKRFEGVEECYICFAILHSVSHQLPKLSCQTCRKKFHSHCLYKWFTTSNKSTCPICRNLF